MAPAWHPHGTHMGIRTPKGFPRDPTGTHKGSLRDSQGTAKVIPQDPLGNHNGRQPCYRKVGPNTPKETVNGATSTPTKTKKNAHRFRKDGGHPVKITRTRSFYGGSFFISYFNFVSLCLSLSLSPFPLSLHCFFFIVSYSLSSSHSS